MTALQFEKPITDLRRRMLQDMTNRNFGAKTQHDYIRHIETFARFLGRAPNTATGDDIRRFQAEQIAQGAQPPKMNTQASALRFFLSVTCGRADLAHQIARTHYPNKAIRSNCSWRPLASPAPRGLLPSTRETTIREV